jgi:hypothetical protein
MAPIDSEKHPGIGYCGYIVTSIPENALETVSPCGIDSVFSLFLCRVAAEVFSLPIRTLESGRVVTGDRTTNDLKVT